MKMTPEACLERRNGRGASGGTLLAPPRDPLSTAASLFVRESVRPFLGMERRCEFVNGNAECARLADA